MIILATLILLTIAFKYDIQSFNEMDLLLLKFDNSNFFIKCLNPNVTIACVDDIIYFYPIYSLSNCDSNLYSVYIINNDKKYKFCYFDKDYLLLLFSTAPKMYVKVPKFIKNEDDILKFLKDKNII